MTDKTPKELAMGWAFEFMRETDHQYVDIQGYFERAWLAGYHSRDTEVESLESELRRERMKSHD